MRDHAIGYSTIEDWQQATDHLTSRVLYLCKTGGIRYDEHFMYRTSAIMLQVHDDHSGYGYGYIHYVLFSFEDRQFLLTGDPFGDTGSQANEKILRKIEQVYTLIPEWLQLYAAPKYTGLIVNGLIALPTDLKLLSGWARFLEWDNDAQVFNMNAAQVYKKSEDASNE